MALGRIRTIKPENWSDEAIGSVSRSARLFRDVLLTIADDDGRWRHLPSAILGHGYPYDDDMTVDRVQVLADELHRAGVIHLYKDEKGAYGCFPKWHLHQVINKYRPSTLPAPKDVRCARRSSKGGLDKGSTATRKSRSSTGAVREEDGNATTPLPHSYGPDQEFRVPFPCSVPDPVLVEDASAKNPLAVKLDEVVGVLRSQPRFSFDPGYAGVANMVAAHPNADHVAAAHVAVAWGSDPAYRTTNGARAFGYALADQKKGGGQTVALAAVEDPAEREAYETQKAFRLKMEAAQAARGVAS